jgi:hypothetical protein
VSKSAQTQQRVEIWPAPSKFILHVVKQKKCSESKPRLSVKHKLKVTQCQVRHDTLYGCTFGLLWIEAWAVRVGWWPPVGVIWRLELRTHGHRWVAGPLLILGRTGVIGARSRGRFWALKEEDGVQKRVGLTNHRLLDKNKAGAADSGDNSGS